MAITPELLLELIKGKGIRSMRHLCFETSRDLTPEDSMALAKSLIGNADVHGAMAATLLAGHISYVIPEALEFLKLQCALQDDIRVQDCLARAFDHFCLNRSYERAMPVMEEWARDENEIVRRAVVEAPRPWNKKEYFMAKPAEAIRFLSDRKNDASGQVRFSAGRALAEVSEDFPDMVLVELKTWNLNHPPVKHTYSFAAKHLHSKMGNLY